MADDLDPFIIEEIGVGQPLRIELRDTDLPFGRMREFPIFESGGPVQLGEQGGTYLPGRKDPIIQVMQPRQRNLVLKGAFRDHLFGAVGHAREMRDRIEEVKERSNLLKLTWGSDERTVFLYEPKFGEEDAHNITYELAFIVLRSPTSQHQLTAAPDRVEVSLGDLAAQMQAAAAAQRAQQDAIGLQTEIQLRLALTWDTLESALSDVADAAQGLESSALAQGRAIVSKALQVVAAAKNAQGAVQSLADQLSALTADQALQSITADTKADWWESQFGTTSVLDDLADQLRQLRAQAMAKVQKTSRIYRVQTGDTLESIAQTQLGNRARASDLGISQSDLVPGEFVRIPDPP